MFFVAVFAKNCYYIKAKLFFSEVNMLITDQALDFLFINKINNSREFYQQHKEEYRRLVVEPLARLVDILAPTVQSIDAQIECIPKIGKCISRIHRDTRFSYDKSLYRDTAWVSFMRQKKLYNGLPGFFFEISPRLVRWGMGYYCASKEAMESFRELVASQHKLFVRTVKMANDNPQLLLEGESYKRSKRPDLSPIQQLYINKKSVCFIRNEDISILEREDLHELIINDFLALAPAYELFMLAEMRKEHQQPNLNEV